MHIYIHIYLYVCIYICILTHTHGFIGPYQERTQGYPFLLQRLRANSAAGEDAGKGPALPGISSWETGAKAEESRGFKHGAGYPLGSLVMLRAHRQSRGYGVQGEQRDGL